MAQDRLAILELLWSTWARQGETLADDQWRRPTRLGDWTVRMLYAHAAAWPVGFRRLVGQVREFPPPPPGPGPWGGASTRPDGIAAGQAGRVAAGARADAATYSLGQL